MREIKFRVWGELSIGVVEIIKTISFIKGKIVHEYSTTEAEASYINIIIEQYTGIKDKNGNEIYEGDIVKCVDIEDTTFPEWTDAIQWDKRGYWTIDGGNVFGDLYLSEQCEIIGNIHENKELS